eukprot:gene2431-biopygen1973
MKVPCTVGAWGGGWAGRRPGCGACPGAMYRAREQEIALPKQGIAPQVIAPQNARQKQGRIPKQEHGPRARECALPLVAPTPPLMHPFGSPDRAFGAPTAPLVNPPVPWTRALGGFRAALWCESFAFPRKGGFLSALAPWRRWPPQLAAPPHPPHRGRNHRQPVAAAPGTCSGRETWGERNREREEENAAVR